MRRNTLLLLVSVVLLCPSLVYAGLVSDCLSSAVIMDSNGNPVTPTLTWPSCLAGDGLSFNQAKDAGGQSGYYLLCQWVDPTGHPIGFIPRDDMWVIDCDPLNDLFLCWGSYSLRTDENSDANGYATVSLPTLWASGCANGLIVVIQGLTLKDPDSGCATPICHSINVRTPDFDSSGDVTLIDLSIFAASFPPNAYETCSDFDGSGSVDLQDMAWFASHFDSSGHVCTFPNG